MDNLVSPKFFFIISSILIVLEIMAGTLRVSGKRHIVKAYSKSMGVEYHKYDTSERKYSLPFVKQSEA